MQLCLGLLLVASCSPAGMVETDTSSSTAAGTAEPDASSSTATESTTTSDRFEHHAYPGADLYLPTAVESAPLVVLVPGGAWETGDRSGLLGLGEHLAGRGVAAAASDLTDGGEGFYYPAPIEEVMCLVSQAVTRMRGLGVVPSSITILGHSTGAHLAALAALAPDRYQTECELEDVSIDGLIGLAGTYDVESMPGLAIRFFGVGFDEDPALWAEGNPVRLAANRPPVPVLLVHGSADSLVPTAETERFADALDSAGHPVTTVTIPDAGHHEVYQAATVGDLIVQWVKEIPEGK